MVSPAQYGSERFKAAASLSERPAVDPRGSDRADDERHIRRAAGLFGERRRLGGRRAEKADALVWRGSARRVAGEKVRHLDETGYQISGKLP